MMNQTTARNNQPLPKGLTGNALKIFATLTMLFDHIALTVVYAILAKSPEHLKLIMSQDATTEELSALPVSFLDTYSVYTILRLVGRIAFPLFAFLLFEGFMHTSDIKKYLMRIGILALISEIPYNLIVSRVNTDTFRPFYPQLQNTVCTLFLGLLMLFVLKRLEADDISPKAAAKQMILQFFCILLTAVIATVLRTDYSYLGILLIGEFYLFRNSKKMQILSGCILMLTVNFAALLAFIPIAMYNGLLLRSKKLQYFFYIFYPVHLLVLLLISVII